MTENKTCYLCGEDTLEVLREKIRHDRERKVFQCSSCGVAYLEEGGVSLHDYYGEGYRSVYSPIIGEESASRGIFEMYLPVMEDRLNDFGHIFKPDMRVLEIGCSAGHFLYSIKDMVAEVWGIEYNKQDAKFVNEELGIKVYTDPIQETDIPETYFDVITLFHVFEHIDKPIEFLKGLRKYIKPGGMLIVEVPNHHEALNDLFDIPTYQDFYYKDPHEFYYSPKSFILLLEKCGFEGELTGIQRYTLYNNLHWALTGQPQKSAKEGMNLPEIVKPIKGREDLKAPFEQFLARMNEEYIELLREYQITESVRFIGKMVE